MEQQLEKACPKYLCGNMVHTGKIIETFPPQYQHKCDVCHEKINYYDIYTVQSKDSKPELENHGLNPSL